MRRYLTKFDAVMRDALADGFGFSRAAFWKALEGKGGPPNLIETLVRSVKPLVTAENFCEPYDDGLTSRSEPSTIRTMRTSEIDSPRKARTGRPMKTKGLSAAGKQLTEAMKLAGTTFAAEGKAVNRNARTVAFYCLEPKDPNYRALPTAIANRWKKEYGVPVGDWPRLAD